MRACAYSTHVYSYGAQGGHDVSSSRRPRSPLVADEAVSRVRDRMGPALTGRLRVRRRPDDADDAMGAQRGPTTQPAGLLFSQARDIGAALAVACSWGSLPRIAAIVSSPTTTVLDGCLARPTDTSRSWKRNPRLWHTTMQLHLALPRDGGSFGSTDRYILLEAGLANRRCRLARGTWCVCPAQPAAPSACRASSMTAGLPLPLYMPCLRISSYPSVSRSSSLLSRSLKGMLSGRNKEPLQDRNSSLTSPTIRP